MLMTWIVPFGFTSFYPATVVLGRGDFAAVARWLLPVAVGWVLLSFGVWRVGLRRYESTGS